MFLPPFQVLLSKLGMAKQDFDSSQTVPVPVPLFKCMLSHLLEHMEFDEDYYLSENPDVAAAVEHGTLSSGRAHFQSHGYFEGRRGCKLKVDEVWYLRTNPDVAAAVRAAKLASGEAHFIAHGESECRAPNEEAQADFEAWKLALPPSPNRASNGSSPNSSSNSGSADNEVPWRRVAGVPDPGPNNGQEPVWARILRR